MLELKREGSIDGLPTKMIFLPNLSYEIPQKKNSKPTDDGDDTKVMFLVAYAGQEEGEQMQPSYNSMSRITRDNFIPSNSDIVKRVRYKKFSATFLNHWRLYFLILYDYTHVLQF